MIRDAEIRRLARVAGVEPRMVELDYALGWALRGLANHPRLEGRLVFKGGTCLRKCYFPEYRFSEDLDFTAVEWIGREGLEEAVAEALGAVQETAGIDFSAAAPRSQVINDEYGRESLRLSIYWRGPHRTRGEPSGLRLDITRHEVLVFEPVSRSVFHPFSDRADLGDLQLPCYRLEEVMSEKIRAVLGQRIYAVSRDLYDIFALGQLVDAEEVRIGLPSKLAARDVEVKAGSVDRMIARENEFRADWERSLANLLPPGAEREFDEVWIAVTEYVARIADGLLDSG